MGPNNIAYIFCDFDSAVESMDKIDQSIRPYTLRKTHELHRQLSSTAIKIKLVKIPGHAGIEENVTED